MLRASLTRPLAYRYFSSTSVICNTSRLPRLSDRPDPEAPSNEAVSSPNSPPTAVEHIQRKAPLEPTENQQPSSSVQHNLDSVKHRIQDWANQTAVTFRAQADDFTARSRTKFSQLGLQLNKLTGYEAIEDLKRDVVDQEARINATRQAARQAKHAYEEAVTQRSSSQRQVNELLQRKSSWTDTDLIQFTEIVRQDHLFQQEEARSKTAVSELEDTLEREFGQLLRTILARYHEEQVWSDKIRSASTYGSFAVLGLNMLVFVLAIVVVEPWKRKRLAKTFERKVEELSRENEARLDASMAQIGAQLANQERHILELSGIPQGLTKSPSIESDGPGVKDAADVAEAREVKTEQTIDRFMLKQDTLLLVAVGASAFVGGLFSSLWLGN